MPENISRKLDTSEIMVPLDSWREVVSMPVVKEGKPWNIRTLEEIIVRCAQKSAAQALRENQGKIFMTLSGGVDSSLCLALIARICPPETEVHTFTVGGSSEHEDIKYARAVSRIFDTRHHEIIVDKTEKEKIIREFKKFYGDTPATQMMIDRADTNTWTVIKEVAKYGASSVIACDTIDELLGGYWRHRASSEEGRRVQEQVFEQFWGQLASEHLEPFESNANRFGLKVILPYCQKELVEYASSIPVNERASYSSGKMPLKKIAEKYICPNAVINRKKRGFVDAFMEK